MFCAQCGVENDVLGSFCKTCGVALEISKAVSFSDAISLAFKNYVNFHGRSTRAEYWWFFLFTFTLSIVTQIIDSFSSLGVTNFISSLIVLLPSLAVGVRRLHDIGKSGWWLLLWFAVIVGWVILLVWSARKSDGPNKYG
ncbi:MAG: DUF805 domain-containing protein [SAR202 cluster bacterium]|nr:DUF805 domain-containing protein [Chloroflexota bacterium]MQG23033.1 DUF805 domain-containing protein [SAR202 cluster bacterium]|tara:strand:+ start:409 stop:828 length:420 start_codon:yes stop_codon:yes gene_type:complete